ncbi:MAG: hypothetical protein HZB51_31595 [Chloroflexi bacterium]|nr:hypothetical protein [Chloroflexota bacterium]
MFQSSLIGLDAKGKLRPRESICHLRSDLKASLNQERYKSQLSNPAERQRNDIWWITPNGENIVEVIEDIAHSFVSQGIEWFNFHTNLENAFSQIERGHDCYTKFYQAAYFAQHLGYEAKHQEYLKRLNQEKERMVFTRRRKNAAVHSPQDR